MSVRLMTADTARYELKRPQVVPDTGYFGTKNEPVSIGYVIGQLSQVNDKFSVERYGDKSVSMYTLICASGANIRQNDRVVLGDGEYTVVAIMKYRDHVNATLTKGVS